MVAVFLLFYSKTLPSSEFCNYFNLKWCGSHFILKIIATKQVLVVDACLVTTLNRTLTFFRIQLMVKLMYYT